MIERHLRSEDLGVLYMGAASDAALLERNICHQAIFIIKIFLIMVIDIDWIIKFSLIMMPIFTCRLGLNDGTFPSQLPNFIWEV